MEDRLKAAYGKSERRLLLLDYDGTLVPIVELPGQAAPGPTTLEVLKALSSDPKNFVVVISGRDRATLERWVGSFRVALVAEHGAFRRQPHGGWIEMTGTADAWKATVREKMETASVPVPGTMIEEKETSLVWHWRQAETNAGQDAAEKLGRSLIDACQEYGLSVTYGNKVVEVHHASADKGKAAQWFVGQEEWDFMLAAGDDTTDEDMFASMPDSAFTIKVGAGATAARLRIKTCGALLATFKRIAAP